MDQADQTPIVAEQAIPDVVETPLAEAVVLQRGPIVFYCKACKKLVEALRKGKKYTYACPDCKGSDIAFGTEQSIRSYYRL